MRVTYVCKFLTLYKGCSWYVIFLSPKLNIFFQYSLWGTARNHLNSLPLLPCHLRKSGCHLLPPCTLGLLLPLMFLVCVKLPFICPVMPCPHLLCCLLCSARLSSPLSSSVWLYSSQNDILQQTGTEYLATDEPKWTNVKWISLCLSFELSCVICSMDHPH